MLASRAASANARRKAFWQLPSHLRVLAHQQSSSRFFSASASRKIDPVEIVATPPLVVLNGIHAVGIPWYAAIPISAILIRGVFGYYFSTVPSRRRQQIRNNLLPLISPISHLNAYVYEEKLKLKESFSTNTKLRTAAVRVWARIWQTHKLGKRFGAPLLSWSSPLNFGALIASTEAVRIMCGANTGLLSMLLAPFTWIGRSVAPDYFPKAVDPVEKMAYEMAERMERMRDQSQGQDVTSEAGTDAALSSLPDHLIEPASFAAGWFDPSLKVEGLAWFTDLTMADPSGLLPFAAAFVMTANIALNPRKKPLPISSRMKPLVSRLPGFLTFPLRRYSPSQHLGMVISWAFGFVLQNVPAGVVLYFLTTFSINIVQRKWLDWKMPLRPGILPCVRPPRVRSRKQWSARR